MYKKRITVFTAIVYLSCVCICMTLNVTGPVLNDVMEHYSIPLSRGGLMNLFQYGGGVIAIAFSSVLINRSNKAIAFIFPLLILGLSTLFIGLVPPFYLFITLYLFMGVGLTMGDTLTNALVPDLQRDNKDKALSLLHGMTGGGAIIMAFLSGFILDSGLSWNVIYMVIGVILLSFAALNAINYAVSGKYVKTLVVPSAEAHEKRAFGIIFKDKRIWISMLIFLFFCFCQSTIVVWAPQYCKSVFGVSSLASNMSIAAYWGGSCIMRLIFGFTKLHRLDTRLVSVIGCILSGIVLFIGMLIHNYYVLIASICIFALLNGPMQPLMISLTNSYHREHSGLISCALFIGTFIAYATAPLLAGVLAASLGMDAIIIFIAACVILSGLTALMVPKAKKSAEV